MIFSRYPNIDPQNTISLIIGTPDKVPLNLGNLLLESGALVVSEVYSLGFWGLGYGMQECKRIRGVLQP